MTNELSLQRNPQKMFVTPRRVSSDNRLIRAMN